MSLSPAWQKKLPMMATNARMLLAPVIFAVLTCESVGAKWLAVALFILASLTDWLDGYWARKYQAESNMGKFMDPIADKVLVLTVLILLVYQHRVDPYAPALLLSRDILIGGLRSVASANQVVIAAKPTGKWKTAFQMVAIPCLFVDFEIMGVNFQRLGQIALWISVALSVISGVQYALGYFKGIRSK